MKEKIWVEVKWIPNGIDGKDTLLFQGHRFVKRKILEKIKRKKEKKSL